MCNGVCIDGSCTMQDLAGVEFGETSSESVCSEDVKGMEDCKGCVLSVATDLGGAWR